MHVCTYIHKYVMKGLGPIYMDQKETPESQLILLKVLWLLGYHRQRRFAFHFLQLPSIPIYNICHSSCVSLKVRSLQLEIQFLDPPTPGDCCQVVLFVDV